MTLSRAQVQNLDFFAKRNRKTPVVEEVSQLACSLQSLSSLSTAHQDASFLLFHQTQHQNQKFHQATVLPQSQELQKKSGRVSVSLSLSQQMWWIMAGILHYQLPLTQVLNPEVGYDSDCYCPRCKSESACLIRLESVDPGVVCGQL